MNSRTSGWSRIAAEIVGIVRNLRRDTAGNTLAIMAAALIPLAAFSGSAIDMARLYVVKVRLQQACDAGALAGRRFMKDTTLTDIDDAAKTQANTFFANNFKQGWFGTTDVGFVATKTVDPSDNTQKDIVTGTAHATVPMTVMAMFYSGDARLTATCQAQYDIPDLDIMFVLDTTGSMACTTSDDEQTCDYYALSHVVDNGSGVYSVTKKSGSRIDGLQQAVLSFFDTVTSQADPKTNFRFGFVPYSATVNVGHLLPRSYIADSWTYQTRAQGSDSNNGTATVTTTTSTSKATCDAKAGHSAWTTNVPSYSAHETNPGYTATNTTTSWSNASSGTCTVTKQPVKATFLYHQATLDVSTYANFTAVTNPAMLDSSTSTWNGCIEERGGNTAAASFSASSPPLDLDVDTQPSSVANTKWGPMWTDVEFMRKDTTQPSETNSYYRIPLTRFQSPYPSYFGSYEIADNLNEVPCPAQASAISAMTLPAYSTNSVKAALRTTMNNYLNGLRPYGNTYHDVGMTWGTRLMSESLFPADAKKPWNDSNTLHRFIIFLTDGVMEPDAYAYTSHGMEVLDKRVTNGTTSQLTNYHNTRFSTACTIAKNRNIHVFVIAFAQTMTPTLQSCANTVNDAYYAKDTAALKDAFTDIAKKTGTLRIVK